MSPLYAHRMMTPGAPLRAPRGYVTRGEDLPELHVAVLNVCARGCRISDLRERVNRHLQRHVHLDEAREAVDALVAGELLREGRLRQTGEDLMAYVSTDAGLRAVGRRS